MGTPPSSNHTDKLLVFLPIDPEGQQGVEPDVEHAVCKWAAEQRPLAFPLAFGLVAVEKIRVVMMVG